MGEFIKTLSDLKVPEAVFGIIGYHIGVRSERNRELQEHAERLVAQLDTLASIAGEYWLEPPTPSDAYQVHTLREKTAHFFREVVWLQKNFKFSINERLVRANRILHQALDTDVDPMVVIRPNRERAEKAHRYCSKYIILIRTDVQRRKSIKYQSYLLYNRCLVSLDKALDKVIDFAKYRLIRLRDKILSVSAPLGKLVSVIFNSRSV